MDPTVRIKVPKGLATPSGEERALHEASGHVLHCCWCQWSIAADKPHLRGQQQMKPCQESSLNFADLGQEEDQVLPIPSLNAVDVGSGSFSAILCPTREFSENLVKTILAFGEVFGHNVVMLHSDQ